MREMSLLSGNTEGYIEKTLVLHRTLELSAYIYPIMVIVKLQIASVAIMRAQVCGILTTRGMLSSSQTGNRSSAL